MFRTPPHHGWSTIYRTGIGSEGPLPISAIIWKNRYFKTYTGDFGSCGDGDTTNDDDKGLLNRANNDEEEEDLQGLAASAFKFSSKVRKLATPI
ncbi:hypothetical protein AC578_4139 [Pseudocercospora eumusae]|uniref:Uncharacterized protein n=1 Tax=Pseudocercospora eumusae TaxID=321146 RepID=A0A139HF63_9PEZI|nr:hypothetical protein AC578_4139 [Pseudocercospora eumusae]